MLVDTDLGRARALYPHTAQGKLYFNHAGTGPLSTRVVAAMTDYLMRRSQGDLDTYQSDLPMVKECRGFVQKLINAASPDRIAFSSNTSDAINIIASGIPWKSGDRIVLNNLEFPANVWPYLNLKSLGVHIDEVKSADGRLTPDMVQKALRPRTRLVALSAVQYLSGHRADIGTIGEICQKHGIIFAVDGIQAVGAVRIDVQKMKIDALSAGSQKWQLGPHGTGFLYLTEELQSIIRQTSLGWLGVADPWEFSNFDQPLASTARRYEGGSLNMPGLWGLHASLATLIEFGPEPIEEQILELSGRLISGFRNITGVNVVTAEPPAERAGIVTIEPPSGVDSQQVYEMMAERAMTIAVRQGKLRYSPHFYNTVQEMDSAIDITRDCISSIQNRRAAP